MVASRDDSVRTMPDELLSSVVDEIAREPSVLGVLLTGSQARSGMSTTNSDIDLLVIALDESEVALPSIAGVDYGRYSEAQISNPGLPWTDFEGWYNRYAFSHAQVLLDRSAGRLSGWIRGQAFLTEIEAGRVVPDQLDGYLNLIVRAAKSSRDLREAAAVLDAAESLSWALSTAFALERRVRPFNKYLAWELEHHPLSDGSGEYSVETFVATARGDDTAPWLLAQQVVEHAQRRGFQSVFEGWGDDGDVLLDQIGRVRSTLHH